MNKAMVLRELLTSPRLIRAAGAHDGLGAALVERAGFDAVWASSFGVSAARALPDASLLSMTEYLQASMYMNAACTIPVIADCDTGFGNALNVAHMVRQFEAAGIAAVCIEDKAFPKVNSFVDSHQSLLDAETFAYRLRVAKATQTTPEFVVMARTEALIAGLGLDHALHRAGAYADAGADAILVHSKKKSSEELEDFLRKWDRPQPIVAVPTTYYRWTAEQAEEAGIKIVIYANQALRASVTASRKTLRTICSTGSSEAVEDSIAPMSEIFELQQLGQWLALEP